MKLTTYDVKGLVLNGEAPNLRRDLHTFVAYVRERMIKRAVRSNQLPKGDVKRIAKLMSWGEAIEEVNQYGTSIWVDAIDNLAHRLGFVKYNIDGEYANYSSQTPSFPDNYIEFQEHVYADFLALSQLRQEQRILQMMQTDSSYSELHGSHWLSVLHGFSSYSRNSAGMMYADFVGARQYLLNTLSKLESGVWYSVDSLIAHVKKDAPYFLIPKTFPKKNEYGHAQTIKRYGSCYEYDDPQHIYFHSSRHRPIPDDAPDGFKRVEGRFIERFLEGIPLTLGYLDVAYTKGTYQGKYPELGWVRAFRLRAPFIQMMRGESLEPRVVIQPNMEVLLETTFYSPSVTRRLEQFAEVTSEDTVTLLRLNKQLVKATVAAEEGLDPVAELARLAGRPLPANVARELTEWAVQAGAFTLYSGVALLEGDAKLPESAEFTLHTINKNLRLVKRPQGLLNKLEDNERVPLWINHTDKAFALLPHGARSVFPNRPKPKAKSKRKSKPRIELQRETLLTLHMPTVSFYTKFQAALVEQRCIFEADNAKRTITYAKAQQPKIDAALKSLKATYTIKIADM